MTPREEAIADCKYANNLGYIALQEHINQWLGFPPSMDMEEDYAYWIAMVEIKQKYNTEECLLKEA